MTGATGFIGKHVVKKLQKKSYNLTILSRSEGCDLLNYSQVDQFLKNDEANTLIHLAWDVTHGEYWNSPKNIQYRDASIHLFEKFLDYGGKKIIGIGSCAEYPTSADPAQEDMVVDKNLLTPYGCCKRETFEWLEQHHTDFTWLRIFGIYGQGEHPDRLFPSMIRAIKEDKEFLINNPDTFYDYIWVGDVADCIAGVIDKPGLGSVNIGTGKSMGLADICEKFKKYLKKNDNTIQTVTKPSTQSRIPDCVKLQQNHFKYEFSCKTYYH